MRFWMVTLAASLFLFSGCGSEMKAPVSVADMPAGEKLFRLNCSSCHAMGKVGFRSIDGLLQQTTAIQDEAVFLGFLRDPKRVGQYNMPGFRPSEISDEEGKTLYHWLKTTYGSDKDSTGKVQTGVQAKLFSVILLESGENSVAVIKAIRTVTGLGLADAKMLTDSPSSLIKANLTEEEAVEVKTLLEATGAVIELKEVKAE